MSTEPRELHLDDTISQFSIGLDGKLTPLATATATATGAPLSIAVDSGGYVYVTTGTGLLQYGIGTGGALTPLTPPTVGTLSGNWVTVNQ